MRPEQKTLGVWAGLQGRSVAGFLLAVGLLAAGAPARAAEETSTDPIVQARDLRLAGDIVGAEKIYAEILAVRSDDADALTGRGFCRLRRSDQTEEALQDFERAIAVAPAYVDAYVGAAIALRRLGKPRDAMARLEACRTACGQDEAKLRYLAESAWREGHFPLARELDRRYPPKRQRWLIPEPHAVYLTYGYDILEQNADHWTTASATYVRRVRPDWSWSVGYGAYRRYQQADWDVSGGGTYRRNYRWAAEYQATVSDGVSFLADQKHRAALTWNLRPRTEIQPGVAFAQYDGAWSRRGTLDLRQHFGNAYVFAGASAGQDTASQTIHGLSGGLGYDLDLRYAFEASYFSGNETVEIPRADEFDYRNDDLDTITARLRYYTSRTTGFLFGGSYEWRNQEAFRQGFSVSYFEYF